MKRIYNDSPAPLRTNLASDITIPIIEPEEHLASEAVQRVYYIWVVKILLRDVAPGAFLRRVARLEALPQSEGAGRLQVLIKRTGVVGVEITLHPHNLNLGWLRAGNLDRPSRARHLGQRRLQAIGQVGVVDVVNRADATRAGLGNLWRRQLAVRQVKDAGASLLTVLGVARATQSFQGATLLAG